MLTPHVQIEWNGWRIESVRPDVVARVYPEDGAPKGRKAAQMAVLWRSLRQAGAVGVLWQDPDVVGDPDDFAAMHAHIGQEPSAVHVAAHKLWPASTGRERWSWGFGTWDDPHPVMGQIIPGTLGWFAMGLTWTPSVLLDLALPHMPFWEYGQVDMGLSRLAREHRIPIRIVPGAQPRHLHFDPREGDAGWRPGRDGGR